MFASTELNNDGLHKKLKGNRTKHKEDTIIAVTETGNYSLKNQSNMFTIDQIKAVHSKVKSGADFPHYVQEMKVLGIIYYDFYVADGHTDYYGGGNFSISSEAKYTAMAVADTGSLEKLQQDLMIHQQGHTDFPTFCKQAAKAGVEKWTVHMIKMTCNYYDKTGNEMLIEAIPTAEFSS